MISIRDVSMEFTIPRPVIQCVLHPFRPAKKCVALSGVRIDFARGERVALLGPNGAGKTTLLKLIGGLFLPKTGEITINGISTTQSNTAARRSVGFVMNEERSFFWRLTGRENLEFFGALENIHGRLLKSRIDELIEVTGLSAFVDKPFSAYSSGMKQRLAMARGLLADPDVLILDEPTRTLDPVACDELIELILKRIHADAAKTLLIATHRFDEAYRLCDRVLVINAGRIASDAALPELAARDIGLASHYRRSLAAPGGLHVA